MNLFRKLFGLLGKPERHESPPDAAMGQLPEAEPIKVFDKYGRELLVSRKDWIEGVLLAQLRKDWDHPDALAGLLIQSFNDGIFHEVEFAAERLHAIDPDRSRGVCLLGIVYLQTERAAAAEKVLRAHVRKHGGDGVVFTNLAKALAVQGRERESLDILWQGLEQDPNQDNAVSWYESIHREVGGADAGVAALRRIAAVPGSWRPRLWLARGLLESRDLDPALELYREALEMAPRPVPVDLLMQMSGDLGNHGYLPELMLLTAPHYDVDVHGITVGNNLIKAGIDTGHLDEARVLLRRLEACQRPDWRDSLGYWEAELAKAEMEVQSPVAADSLRMSMLSLVGPLWLIPDHRISQVAATREADAPHIVFLGSSFESAEMSAEVKVRLSDNPGRMSRALPLYLNEIVHLRSDARTTSFVPWILNGAGGFGLFGKAPDLEAMSHEVRQQTSRGVGRSADFLVSTHLVTRGENWKVAVSLVRTIDGKLLCSRSYDFPEMGFQRVSDPLVADLLEDLANEAGIVRCQPPPCTELAAAELDHYLFRLEQTLAVRCSRMDGVNKGFLSNPAEILDGMVYLGLQNPEHLPSRILLWRCLDGLKESEPELVRSMSAKGKALQSDFPLGEPYQSLLDQEFAALFAAC